MSREIARRSVLGALLAAWWTAKQGDSDRRLSVADMCILAGLGLTWALERYAERKPKQDAEHDTSAKPDLDTVQAADGREGKA